MMIRRAFLLPAVLVTLIDSAAKFGAISASFPASELFASAKLAP